MTIQTFQSQTKKLIDNLKAVCSSYGLGNDGNEFKIITQAFLYKFLNDKFAYEIKEKNAAIKNAPSWEEALKELKAKDFGFLTKKLSPGTAIFKPEQLITNLFNEQNDKTFSQLFDEALCAIANKNSGIFSVKTDGGEKINLFENNLSKYISDPSKRDSFCLALINKLAEFSFEHMFTQKYDFYATIFEYLIKDYNKDNGGSYAEYYTPHAVAKIMASILVTKAQQGIVKNVTCYDPSAGSGTLLMNLAHVIGTDCCSIYSQDISQKSSGLLRLNLILNNLVHSIPNVIQGNTLLHPYHKDKKFDYIVSNPPFKMDFSDFRNKLDSIKDQQKEKYFFAGIPTIPKKKKESMAIYLLFLQHIINSLSDNGKAAIVVPTGFTTSQSAIERKIREKLIDDKILAGVVSMPSNIFATTGTNVSILFIDKENKEEVVLIDTSSLGTKVKEGKNQKTLLSSTEEEKIITTFNNKAVVDNFSVKVTYEEIEAKNYSFSAGQYFEVKIEYVDITEEEFEQKMQNFNNKLDSLFNESRNLESEIRKQMKKVEYEV